MNTDKATKVVVQRTSNEKMEAERLQELGEIVADVDGLLYSLASLRDNPRADNHFEDLLQRAQQNAMLVCSHALDKVWLALRKDAFEWERKSPEYIKKERASIKEYLREEAERKEAEGRVWDEPVTAKKL